MYKLSSYREAKARTSAIYWSIGSHLDTHESATCEPIHPRSTHDQFMSLPIAEKLTLYYDYVLKKAQEALESGDTHATIKLCEHSLLKWWPYERRAFDLLNQALEQANRTLDDHVATTVFGKSVLFVKSTDWLWKTYFFRSRVEPWVNRILIASAGAFVTLGILGAFTEPVLPLSDYADIIWPVMFGIAGILALSVTTKLLLTGLPDPSSLRHYWYSRYDWVDGHVPWDTYTWPESFKPFS